MFGSLNRDMERDPIFGAHSRAMSQMMNSFFGDFGDFGGFRRHSAGNMGMGMDLMPFGGFGMPMQFPSFPQMAMGPANMQQMLNPDPMGGASYSSMTVMSMQSNGNGGAPIVYQASSSTRQAPGGVKETRKTVTDSQSGVKKMSVGRHLGERAHIMEREENMYTGQREENEDLINLDFEEKPQFEREWRSHHHHHGGGHSNAHRMSITNGSHGHGHQSSSAGRSATYTPSVTIEEVSSDTEETVPTQRALPPIPMVSSTSSRRLKDRDRRHKTAATKRSKKH